MLLQEDAEKVVKLARQVKDSFRLIVRFVHRHPDPNKLFEQLSYDVEEKAKSSEAYKSWTDIVCPLNEYMDIVKRRLRSVDKRNEMDQETVLLHLKMTKRHNQDRVTRLFGVYEEMKRKRETRKAQGTDVVESLKQEKKALLHRVQSDRGSIRTKVESDINKLSEAVKERKKDVKKSCKDQSSKLGKLSVQHQEHEFLLLRKTRHTKMETEKVIRLYDKKMFDLTKRLEAITKRHAEEELQSQLLKEQVDMIVAERVAWEKVLMQRQREADMKLAQLHAACLVIQRVFRNYLARRPPKKKKNKGKGKGKAKKNIA